MASSSTSSFHKSFKYDVFLSFRGEDTRKNFVDHLYHAFQQKHIHTYKDDQIIKKGKRISDELIGSIEDSKFYIIVFSKNYASSSWCLDELVKIMECHRTTEHTAYPVFYDVEPSEVRKQSGAVGEAFAKHETEVSTAGIWRDTLKEAAGLAGWDLKSTADGYEVKFIQKIVEELSLQLRSISSNIDEKLVGMETRIQEVVSSLGTTDFDDVRMIGIKGMGGGGKTTLARAVFDRISFEFEGVSFVENVREVSNASFSGLRSLQNQVLSDVTNDKGISVSGVYEGVHIMKRTMRDKKVLVVLDDVDNIDQLEALAGDPGWFKSGSRIIITTRDEQVLVAHNVKFTHDVNLLSGNEAVCLFSRYAFGKDIPVQGYEKLSREVVRYAAGLPLTLRVLGSFLCGKSELEWIDALRRLKTIPLTETLKILELSYISLEEDYKKIFLDVACILKGWAENKAIKALESCGFHARNGLRVLEQKTLITINHNRVGMHDHIEEMGRNIVRRLHPDKPHKHSRLWIDEEIEDILANDLGNKATQCIQLYTEKLNPHIVIRGVRKMKDLRFLSVVLGGSICDTEFNMVSPDFPNALQYLDLNRYPYRSLPITFHAYNIVTLKMPYSKIVQLWEGGERKVLKKLRFLDLSRSMLTTFDLGLTPNIEELTLYRCYDLEDLHVPIVFLKLMSVDLSNSKLRTLDLRRAPYLETLILAECHNLEELHMPRKCLNLISLNLTNSKLRTLHIGLTPNLEYLILRNCYYLEELHMADECQKLTCLDISHSKLRTLNIGLTPNLEKLYLQNCYYLEELQMADECQKLTSLNISHSKLRTLNLGLTPNLEKLELKGVSDFVEHHTPIGCLKKLVRLDLDGCLRLISFICKREDSCSLHELVEVGPFAELELIEESVESHTYHRDNNLPKFRFRCFYKEDRPSFTRNLEMLICLDMYACTNLQTLFGSIFPLQCLRKLKIQGRIFEAPKDLDQLECLEELILWSTKINHLPENICMLKHLKSLELISCMLLEELPKDLGRLECLEKLIIIKCKFLQTIPTSICKMKCLKLVHLRYCIRVEKLPEDLGRLECLKELDVGGTSISHLPQSVFLLNGLFIIGSRELLQSCGFTFEIQTLLQGMFCYARVPITPTVGASSTVLQG